MFALHTATNSIFTNKMLIRGYDCFYISVLTVTLFVFEHKKMRYTPLVIAIVAYLCGVVNFLSLFEIITPLLYKALISSVLLLMGGFIIICNYFKTKIH